MVSIGTGMGSSEELVSRVRQNARTRHERGQPAGSCRCTCPTARPRRSGLERHAKAGVMTPVSACASGSEGIARAWQQIVLGEADIAICGGVETKIEAVPIACVRRDAHRVVEEQRRPGRRLPPVRQRPQRVRLRRGRRVDGDRDRGTRQGTRRQHPGQGHGGERHLRRLPHGGTGSQRRAGRACDHPGDPAGRPHTGRHRPRQRPRHRHLGRRPGRGQGHQQTRWARTVETRRCTHPSPHWATRSARSAPWNRS